MPRPCEVEHPTLVDRCFNCWLAANSRGHQKKWGLQITAPAKRPQVPDWVTKAPSAKFVDKGPCLDRGDPIGPAERISLGISHLKDWVRCESKKPLAPTGKPVCGCEGCRPGCPGYRTEEEPEPPKELLPAKYNPVQKKHLIYHLYPGGRWKQRVLALVDRWDLFDGAKHIAIATDKNTLPYRKIRDFLPSDAKCFEVANDPRDQWRERVSWLPLWFRILEEAGDDDAILRAHSKATRRTPDHPSWGLAPWWWTEISESLCMDHWSLIASRLRRFPIVGAFKTAEYVWKQSTWHYAGSFYWVRAGEAKSRKWKEIEKSTWGVESWPGKEFSFEEGGEIFPFSFEGDPVTAPHRIYEQEYWEQKLWPAYRQWKAFNKPEYKL